MADSVEVSNIETTDGTIGVIRDNAARQSIANIKDGKETVGAVDWENVKGHPTKVSELENDKNYQTDENVDNTLNGTLYAGSSTHGGPATSADKLTTARTISLDGAAAGSGSFDGSANSTINVSSLDATKLTGVVPIANLPPSVVERMSIVKDDTERLALTKDTVQDGDVVKVQSSGLMYYVVDDTKLNEEAGYEVFKAGTAASVPWGGVTDKPDSYPPSSHTHTKSQITDFPSSLPNPSNLTMQIEGDNAAVYNGSTSQTFNVTKSSLGLDKVNNTADADKSVKYAASAGNADTATGHSLGLNIPSPSVEDQDKFLSAKGVWESITGKIEGTKVTSAETADKLATARNITVGSSSKKFDGSSDVSYSLSEIGVLGTSDVHDWAKAENKPSYSWNEITNKPSTFTPSSHTHTKDQVGLGNVDNTADKDKSVKYASSAGTVNGHTINSDVPANVKWDEINGGSKVAKYTLTAANWSGSSAPYTYDLGPTYGANAIIGFDSATGTEEQLEAASAANIQGSSNTKIYAYGDKPTVDIPIVIHYQ